MNPEPHHRTALKGKSIPLIKLGGVVSGEAKKVPKMGDLQKMTDFLFSWKEDHWSHENVRSLVDRFNSGETVVEPWLCAAHASIRPGDIGYLLKQGERPKGIFGVAVANAPAYRGMGFRGEDDYVPLRITALVDPKQRLLVSEEELLALPGEPSQWVPRQSGVRIRDRAAAEGLRRLIERQVEILSHSVGSEDAKSASRKERLLEVFERDQRHVRQLKSLYKGHCQICNSAPFAGKMGDLSEGHHIKWLSRGGADAIHNMMLLCPNHHSAVHALDLPFDWDRLEFKGAGIILPVRLDRHLRAGEAK